MRHHKLVANIGMTDASEVGATCTSAGDCAGAVCKMCAGGVYCPDAFNHATLDNQATMVIRAVYLTWCV